MLLYPGLLVDPEQVCQCHVAVDVNLLKEVQGLPSEPAGNRQL